MFPFEFTSWMLNSMRSWLYNFLFLSYWWSVKLISMLINLSLSCSPVNKGFESQLISVICNQEVKDSGVSVSKGIHTLIDANKEWKDTNHIYLSNINEIKVHIKCRENYTRPSNIV